MIKYVYTKNIHHAAFYHKKRRENIPQNNARSRCNHEREEEDMEEKQQ